MEKKNNGLLIAIIILLVLGLIGSVGYIVYDKVINNKDSEKVIKGTKEINVPVEKEEEIKSINLKNELKNKMNYLYSITAITGVEEILYKEASLEKLSDDQKLAVALNSLFRSGNTQDITQNNYLNEIIRIHNLSKENQSLDYVNDMYDVILDSDVKDRYQELFGTKLKNMVSRIRLCPSWTYSESIKAYISNGGCGGTSPINVITYNNKYTLKGNEAYVYISSGTTKFGSLYTEYSEDLDSKTPYKKFDDNQTTNDYQKVLEENYKDFSEYKATFKKNADGDYYFYSVKRIDK